MEDHTLAAWSPTLTWMMLCMCGMRRSMRTSSSMTRALHTFFLTSLSSSPASANKLWTAGTEVQQRNLHPGRRSRKRQKRRAHLNESVDVIHESLSAADDELVHTRYGMRPERETKWSLQCRFLPGRVRRERATEEHVTDLILGLQCLKNCRNLGIMMLSGLLRASLSNSSEESSQIFCNAPKEP